MILPSNIMNEIIANQIISDHVLNAEVDIVVID